MEQLSAALTEITGDSGQCCFAASDVQGAGALFVVARGADGALLGCGALRPLGGDVAEIKRMYARPGTRGVGAALLAHLEAAAVDFGYAHTWLATRRVNPRAVAVYRQHGYGDIPNYGKHAGRTEAICLGKRVRR